MGMHHKGKIVKGEPHLREYTYAIDLGAMSLANAEEEMGWNLSHRSHVSDLDRVEAFNQKRMEVAANASRSSQPIVFPPSDKYEKARIALKARQASNKEADRAIPVEDNHLESEYGNLGVRLVR